MRMDITPYVDGLRRDLQSAAEAGGDELRGAAERLAFALDPAARLALMEAISQAAAEITAELPDGSVDVRLNGRELDFVVDIAPAHMPVAPAPPAPPAPPSPEEDDEGGMARVSLRIPESLKAKAEEKAAAAGQSLNTWLISTVRAATDDAVARVDIDLSSIPFVGYDPFAGHRKPGSRRMTGWV